MKKILFNKGWEVIRGVVDPFAAIFGNVQSGKPVMLPQDAMILEKRDKDCKSGSQSGFYPAKTYTYDKTFFVPADWQDRQSYIEFEGVMSKALVYLNGELIGKNKYGYSQFFVDLNRHLRFGENNTLKVIAENQEHGSRWYPGSGIYRDVYLHQGSLIHVEPEGVRITTEAIYEDYAVISVKTQIRNTGLKSAKTKLVYTILDHDGKEASSASNTVSILSTETVSTSMRLTIEHPKRWSPENPALNLCKIQIVDNEQILDETEESFGIRTLAVDARRGFRINGQAIKLRGACIHHDNGIIGTTTLYQAEEFRLKRLKEAGFNSIRSAHHPVSKAMLEVCDRLGMLVIDELADMWNDPKNSSDYAIDFGEIWKDEARKMVAKDYNHPSVIFYSLGNEIPEIGRRSGARFNRELANCFRSLDPSRFVTGAFSGFLAVTDHLGEMAEQMKQYQPQDTESKDEEKNSASLAASQESSGSEGLNAAMSKTQKDALNAFSVSPLLSECLEEASCELEVVGYNYLTARHEHEHIAKPDRVVVGSETYPTEIADLWKIVIDNNHVIGDFTWTGYDYLGEAGIGIYHYDSDRDEQGWYPDRLAYCGDININGYRRPVSYLREIVYGIRKMPFIAVERVNRFGQKYKTNDWKYADAIDSWTFNGFEGNRAKIHVFSSSDEVELFLNGISLGRRQSGQETGYDVIYEAVYEPGQLLAIGYTDGKETGRITLETAEEPTQFNISTSNDKLIADGRSVVFVTADLVDADETPNRWIEKDVTFLVEGDGVLAGLGSADPSSVGSYSDNSCRTFDGRVMAAIRSTEKSGCVTIKISAQGCASQEVNLPAVSDDIP